MLLPFLLLATARPAPADPVVLSFAFFGCNRLAPEEWDPKTNPSSANLPQLRQTFDDVAAISPRPALLFAGGDLVMNYADDAGEALRSQLDAWAVEARRVPKAIELVAIPGNHELNRKRDKVKESNPATLAVWNDWVARTGFARRAGNGPSPRTDRADGLGADDSRTSYAFDLSGVRFIVLNTDALSTVPDEKTGTAIGWIPAAWAANRIAEADRDPKLRAVFVLGHRNLLDGASVKGDAPVDPRAAAPLIRALSRSKKARAYVCAHVHAWDVSRPFGRAAQLIAGNGGSPLEKEYAKEPGADFGFVLIRVHRSGRAGYVRYRRPLPPSGYAASEPVPPARPEPERPL